MPPLPTSQKSPTNLNQGDCRSQLHYLRLNKHINYTNKHYAIHGNVKILASYQQG